jgi:TolA-binding protein
MKIQNTTQPFTGKLTPLNEYKGPILKLTKADKKEIAILQKEIIEAETKIYDLKKSFKENQYSKIQDWYAQSIGFLEQRIVALKSNIKEIKVQRLKMQKGENLDTIV